jgi:hypothetical protein
MAQKETYSRDHQCISRLVELAKSVHMSEEQRIEQRNSFVYGNTRFENDQVTREMVENIAKKITIPAR